MPGLVPGIHGSRQSLCRGSRMPTELVQRTQRLVPGGALTRLPPDYDTGVGTLSRNAGEGLQGARRTLSKPLSRSAGEGGPSPQGWVGEGLRLNLLFGYDH